MRLTFPASSRVQDCAVKEFDSRQQTGRHGMGAVAEDFHMIHKNEPEKEKGNWKWNGFLKLQVPPYWHTSSYKATPSKTPKHFHQLQTKHSNMGTMWATFIQTTTITKWSVLMLYAYSDSKWSIQLVFIYIYIYACADIHNKNNIYNNSQYIYPCCLHTCLSCLSLILFGNFIGIFKQYCVFVEQHHWIDLLFDVKQVLANGRLHQFYKEMSVNIKIGI